MTERPRRRRLSNVVGFDDAPFAPDHVGDVKVVGTIYARRQLNGVLVGQEADDGLRHRQPHRPVARSRCHAPPLRRRGGRRRCPRRVRAGYCPRPGPRPMPGC